MKKMVLSAVVACAMTVSALAAVPAMAEDVIKIGLFEPLTGENGGGGTQEAQGAQYANEVRPTVTIDGTEYKVELDTVDNKSDKNKHSIKSDIDLMKLNVDEYKKMRKEAKEDRKVSRKTMNHTYRIQTRMTRKRMMASRCEAARFNGDHKFFCETLHQFWRHGDFMPFHIRQNKCKMITAKK